MPGLQRSPGLADIDVCYGAHKAGAEGVQSALQKARWTYDNKAQPERGNSVDLSRFSYPDAMLGDLNVDAPYEEDDGSPSPGVHEGFENRISSPPQAKALSFEESGLPPTPPTMNNSDVAQVNGNDRLSPQPLFADGVRNAIHTQASSTTPVNQQVSPPTPDPSPPVKSDPVPSMEQKENPQFLHPLLTSPGPTLSSKAESFKTAHEDPITSPINSSAQVTLPEDDKLPEHWLDSTRALQQATNGLGDGTVEATPREVNSEAGSATPRRRSKHESPPQPVRHDSDWERHISYVSGPDELDGYPAVVEDSLEPATGLGVSGAGLQQEAPPRSAEDLNNMVYKRIQEENVKRHSTVSTNSGAITVGIIVPASELTPKKLRRQTKYGSLRSNVSSNGGKRESGSSIESDRRLRHKENLPERRRTLDESPILNSNIRQVSSPARLAPDASNMTALTFASMQESPHAKNISKFQPEFQHKLRHFSHEARLSNNMSVRRTSLEASPPLGTDHAQSPQWRSVTDPSARKSLGGESKVPNNIAVKRTRLSDTTKAIPRPPKSSNPVRGVIPSVTSEPESPNTRLRRFSREVRLENNENVRRTSLEHAIPSPKQTDMTSGRPSTIYIDKGVVHKQGNVTTGRPSTIYIDKGVVLPSSPRKSLDARFLHPTTTPMSTSQMSDRTDVELCEASGVRLYPHNNDSLLVVEHGSRPVSKDKDSPDGMHFFVPSPNKDRGVEAPVFAAQVDPPTPKMDSSRPAHQVDSPLTNPRVAPEPPVFKFIPPTPNEELENELDSPEAGTTQAEDRPTKRLSLAQRARRYSDTLFPRLGSFRRPHDPRNEPEDRDTYLSPSWRPQGSWDEFDSEEEDDYEPPGALPRGGDTSNVGADEDERKRNIFPRAMSKRLPGFRGNGGFLVGNSLGLDRHGTNNRRHYVSTVSTGPRTLTKKQSEELLKNLSANGQHSQESLRRIARVRTFVIPFSGGKKAQWVGAQRFRAKMRALRLAREEREKEKRRQDLRNSIGLRVYHGQ